MCDTCEGQFDVLDEATGSTTIELDGNTADINAGGNGQDGDLSVKNCDDLETIRFASRSGLLRIGCENRNGNLRIVDSEGRNAFNVSGSNGSATIGTAGQRGTLDIRDDGGRQTFYFDTRSRQFRMRNSESSTVINLDADNTRLSIGAHDNPAELVLRNRYSREALKFECDRGTAKLSLGTRLQGGRLEILDYYDEPAFSFHGRTSDMSIQRGDADNRQTVFAFRSYDACLDLGCEGRPGNIRLKDRSGNERLHLSGHHGDILLSGADCAELFAIDAPDAEPGSVMVINDDENLRLCDQPYDSRVAGIISGANGIKPGVVLGNYQGKDRHPIALSGKVFCKVVAGEHPIVVGDLLTTSGTIAHAMKAVDPKRAFGAIIGKALRSSRKDFDLIPVLVALQ